MQSVNADELETLAEECIRQYEGDINEINEELINDEPMDITDCEMDACTEDSVSTETDDVSEHDEETYDDNLYDSLFNWCLNNLEFADECEKA